MSMYENNLNHTQKDIFKKLGWEFNRHGINDKYGNVVVEKFYSNEEIEEYTNLDFLTKELENYCTNKLGIFINYKRNDLEFIPEEYTLPSRHVFEFSQKESFRLISKNYNEMMRNTLLYVLNHKL